MLNLTFNLIDINLTDLRNTLGESCIQGVFNECKNFQLSILHQKIMVQTVYVYTEYIFLFYISYMPYICNTYSETLYIYLYYTYIACPKSLEY